MFCLLQEVGPDFGELTLPVGRNHRSGLIEAVGDHVVQFFPIIQLQTEQPELGFKGLVSHRGVVADSSKVSSSFWRLSINRCAQGRSTLWTWLMMPSSK